MSFTDYFVDIKQCTESTGHCSMMESSVLHKQTTTAIYNVTIHSTWTGASNLVIKQEMAHYGAIYKQIISQIMLSKWVKDKMYRTVGWEYLKIWILLIEHQWQ